MNRYNAIYIITNKENGKSYIGMATDFNDRRKQHLSQLRRNVHYNIHLQRAWNKYGEDSFIFEIVDNVEEPSQLEEKENEWILSFCWDNLYNQRIENYYTLGYKHSEKAKRAISKSLTGRKVSKETREKIGKKHRGKILSKETKRKIGQKSKGRFRTKESIKKGLETKIERYGGMPDRKPVYQIDKDTDEILNRFESIADAVNEVKCSQGNISSVCSGVIYKDKRNNKQYIRKTAGGYKWKFVEDTE